MATILTLILILVVAPLVGGWVVWAVVGVVGSAILTAGGTFVAAAHWTAQNLQRLVLPQIAAKAANVSRDMVRSLRNYVVGVVFGQ